MPPVDQDSKLDGLRTAGVKHGFDCRANRTPGIDDIIYQDNGLPGQVTGDFSRAGLGQRTQLCQIIPVEGDINTTQRDVFPLETDDIIPEHGSQRHAAPMDPKQNKVKNPAVLFDDLVCDPGHAAAYRGFIHND